MVFRNFCRRCPSEATILGHDTSEREGKMAVKNRTVLGRITRLLRSVLHPQVLLHPFRMLHYYGYSHVLERTKITMGRDVRLAPNTSFRNGERIDLGDQVQMGNMAPCGPAEAQAGSGSGPARHLGRVVS